MIYLVTRHPGAVEWLRRRLEGPAVHVEHLDNIASLGPGDIVAGTLPMHLAAQVCARGARYLHLEVELPRELRGLELAAEQLDALNARLVEYRVVRQGRPWSCARTADPSL